MRNQIYFVFPVKRRCLHTNGFIGFALSVEILIAKKSFLNLPFSVKQNQLVMGQVDFAFPAIERGVVGRKDSCKKSSLFDKH